MDSNLSRLGAILLIVAFVLGVQGCAIPKAGTIPENTPSAPIQNQPSTEKAGPWDNDVLVFRINPDSSFIKVSSFERAGVPTIARMKDGRLIAAYQFFPAGDADNFDKVAVRFSSDEGNSWTKPEVIHLSGLATGMRFPFDPTLLILPDGRIRLYFTSTKGQQLTESVPAIYSAISTNGIDYGVEEGVRFAIKDRYVIDCAVVLHQGVFHLFAPDNGASSGLSSQLGNGYHAISQDGLSFTRLEDVKIAGDRKWLGCAMSDGKLITFWGTSQNGGLWRANSIDGTTWQLSMPNLNITDADPGVVASRNGGWIVAATGPPRPGTPSAQNLQIHSTLQGSGQPSSSFNPTMSVSNGPWNHRVMLATSIDGLSWAVSDETVIEQASVPELFLSPEGLPTLIFVDASGQTEPGMLGAMVRQTDGVWIRKQTNLFGADPNVVSLKDGSYRAYTKDKNGTILVFSSKNGLNWQLLGEAFKDDRYPQATDPDVFDTPSGWIMLVSLGPKLLRCISSDGIKFVAGQIIDIGGSVSDTVSIQEGWRTFFHINASIQTGGKMVIRSASTLDGINWIVEAGDRLIAPVVGLAERGVADPAPLQLKDGRWLMAIKSFIR